MNKQGFYITIINSFLGIGASLLLKDNAAIALIIGALVISTVLFIERAWVNEHLFRSQRRYFLTAYSVLAAIFLVGLFFVTVPMRRTSAIIGSTTAFLTGVKSGDYKNAYTHLSGESQKSYLLADFTEDHADSRNKIHDFTIDQVTLNKFDSNKAVAIVSSPFMLYGHETLNLELIKEAGTWQIVLSRNTVTSGRRATAPRVKNGGGKVSNFLNSLF